MNTGRIPTRPSLVHCKFVLIQFPSVLLAQVQPECQFSHNLSYPYRRGLVEIPDERWLYNPLIQVWYTVQIRPYSVSQSFVSSGSTRMSVSQHFSYHSRRGLVEIPDECWSYSTIQMSSGHILGRSIFYLRREHAPHYYYAKDLLPEVDLGWGRSFRPVDCLISACTDLFLHTSYLRCSQGA